MNTPLTLPFEHPIISQIIRAGFRDAKSQHEVQVCEKLVYHAQKIDQKLIRFVRLSDMSSVAAHEIASNIPAKRNTHRFQRRFVPITIAQGFAVISSWSSRKSNLTTLSFYKLYMNREDIESQFSKEVSLIPQHQ